jgi:uncharacterized repeat protein (TIGR02543 family)
VANETDGVWGNAIEVPGSATLNSGGFAAVNSVSCGTRGTCVAGGLYYDTSGSQAFVVSSTQPAATNTVTYNGSTANGGSAPVDDANPHEDGTTVTVLGAGNLTKTGYSFTGWNTAANGTGTGYSAGDTFPMPANDVTLYAQWQVNSYTVTYNGNNATSGSAPVDGSSPHAYDTVVTVLGPGSLTRTGYAFSGWNTAADATGTAYAPGNTFNMPAADVTLYAYWIKLLRSGLTTCRGTFTGTGTTVDVPDGATCTLVPGTYVTQNVTVESGGTLHATGVRIAGKLVDSGSATVCSSRIRLDIQAVSPSGSLELGGPDCQAGNRIGGNVLVSHDSNSVQVEGNTVVGELRVQGGHGSPDSIVGNTVGNLLVRNSGPPVLVQGNHAGNGNLMCTGNTGMTGSGNTASRTNTCPK